MWETEKVIQKTIDSSHYWRWLNKLLIPSFCLINDDSAICHVLLFIFGHISLILRPAKDYIIFIMSLNLRNVYSLMITVSLYRDNHSLCDTGLVDLFLLGESSDSLEPMSAVKITVLISSFLYQTPSVQAGIRTDLFFKNLLQKVI